MFQSPAVSGAANPFLLMAIVLGVLVSAMVIRQLLSSHSEKNASRFTGAIASKLYTPAADPYALPEERELAPGESSEAEDALAAVNEDWKARELAMLEAAIFENEE